MKINTLIGILTVFSLLSCAQSTQVKQVTSTELSEMMALDDKLIVLDVRTPEEFNEGHIKGAINIDINQPDAFAKIDSLNQNAKYVVHCRTNRRSKIAADHMQESGFRNILQLSDGYKGWIQNGFPENKLNNQN